MRRLLILVAVLLGSASVQAQTSVTIHNAPQGVTSCTVPASVTVHTIGTGICPLISFQAHWNPGDGNPSPDPPNTLIHNLAHTHVECNLPEEGEVGGPITIPCRLQAFHLDGQIAEEYDTGQVTSFTVDTPGQWPVVGNPAGVVVVPFHITVDPRNQTRKDNPAAKIIQDHGWANIVFGVRTFVNNGDTYDTQPQWTIWSMVHPDATPIAEGEGSRIQLASKGTAVSARDTSSASWGANLIEFRDWVPMWAPMSGPVAADAFSYTYGPGVTFDTKYQLVCGNDYHTGNAGVELTFATATLPITGELFNHDFIDPLKISQAPAIAGFPANQSRCTFVWQEGTDADPLPDVHTGVVAANQTLFNLISFDVAWTPNPTGCDATCSNAIGASPIVATSPLPPLDPPPTPTALTVPNVVGQTLSNATQALTAAGLTFAGATNANSDTAPAGTVTAQAPAAGISVVSGASVTLIVSIGPATPPAPPVVTLTPPLTVCDSSAPQVCVKTN